MYETVGLRSGYANGSTCGSGNRRNIHDRSRARRMLKEGWGMSVVHNTRCGLTGGNVRRLGHGEWY